MATDVGAMSGHFDDISHGSPTYGGPMSDDQLTAHADLDTKHQVLITGIDLDDDEDLTIEYTAQVPLEKNVDGLSFTLDLDGGEGPDEGDFKNVIDSELTVVVTDAAAGSGSVMISRGEITNDTEDNEVTFTYEAIGEIGEDKKITVTVPDGWSAPKIDADMQGSFTTKHYQAC